MSKIGIFYILQATPFSDIYMVKFLCLMDYRREKIPEMKKTFKIAIVTVLVLLAGGAGSIYYFLNVKEYDVADAKVEEITKADYQIDLPDADSADDDGNSEADGADGEGEVEASGDGSGVNEEDGTTSTSGKELKPESKQKEKVNENPSGSKKSRADVTQNTEKNDARVKEKQAVTAESIKAAYRPVFESLEAQANDKVDSLVSAAYSEYKTKKENGESVSVTYFYRKYSAAGKELESMTDHTFQYVYESLEGELKKRGFSAKEAREFKTQYENAKTAREAALIEKAKAAM